MFGASRSFFKRFAAARRGHVAVITAVAAPAVIGSAGLGMEAGLWFYEQRSAQMAADISAYAGAVVARTGEEYDAIAAGALEEAGRHGYDAARGPIEINWPPVSGPNQNDRSVEVIISQSRPRLLSALFMEGDVTYQVRAVGRYDEPGPACILTLDPAGSQSLLFTGSSDVVLTNCDIMSNSIATDALGVTGSGNVTASCANSVGGMNISSQLILTDCPEPRTNLPPALDPFAGLVEPTASGCRNIPGGGGQAKTIQPGRYCNGMNLSGTVTMEPGVYIVDGGTFRTNGNSNVTGDGVTIFLTGDADIQMNGNADINLTAPETGDYAGLLFWGDDDNFADTSVLFNGTADSSLVGALYFPSQTVDMRGDFSGSGGCTRIIAYRIDISGATAFDSDCSAAGSITIQTPGSVRLVE
jgi:hypothetical protein